MTDAIVVTGMGIVAACGNSPETFFAGLRSGRRHFTSPETLHPAAPPKPFLGVAADLFPEGRHFSAYDSLLLARRAAGQALAQGCGGHVEALGHLGVCAGTTSGSALHFLEGYRQSRQGMEGPFQDVHEFFSANMALALARERGARGPALTIGTACASGADALGMAFDFLRGGVCDSMLCGGADALSVVPHSGFARLLIYDDEPCRPFDYHRKGLNLGEGAAFLLLERENHAHHRGARILGRILGYGNANDAYHLTAPHPDGRGLRAAIRQAVAQAGLTLDDIAFVNAHGTGTRENDSVEGRVLRELLPETPVWASKGCTGHTLGAAGALEAIAAILALRARRIPRSHGFSRPDPAIGLRPTEEESTPASRYALSTSLGFGGGNAALVVAGE